MTKSTLSLDKIISHIRDRSYMSGIQRSKVRIKQTAEVFTPDWLVKKVTDTLDQYDQTLFADPKKVFVDFSVGDGQLLGEALIRKVENGIDFETALSCCAGCDIMQDNVDLTRERLLVGQEHLRHIVEKNIIQGDALKIKNWDFDGTDPYKSKQDLHNETLFEIS